ncbi:PIN-like domain-containing protein [Pseudomonas syringae]|uniref:PIN-like domain-containing protein n=1 Tax=Pseudomonas syringae TaxID=317 RepID=UPI000695F26A|nr:PIN domain-containing protein [Pseudomonas syringae]
MKNSFSGYYPPTPEQYEHLWNEALFVLDTNVLLNLYRLPTLARDELLEVLRLLENRLWIPHQVGLEFQRGRLNVIANERKSTEEALGAAQNVVGQVKQKVEGLQIDKRGLGIESQPLLDQLEKSNQELINAIKAIHTAQIDVSSSDLVRNALDSLLADKVGAAPKSQAELDTIIEKGEERFADKIPPGFADADKDKNPNDATFIFDHIKYKKKFGDLILWKQLLSHVKESRIKTVLFITADRKDDWWWKEQGKTIGPHPELIREIQREGGVELFWMYSSVQFVEQANKYSQAKISTESVAEIQQVAKAELPEEMYPSDFINDRGGASTHLESIHTYKNGSNLWKKKIVVEWLEGQFPSAKFLLTGYTDFDVYTPRGTEGHVITQALISDNITNIHMSTKVVKALNHLALGNINTLSLLVPVTPLQFRQINIGDNHEILRKNIHQIMARTNITSFYVGIIQQGEFQLFMFEHNGYISPLEQED